VALCGPVWRNVGMYGTYSSLEGMFEARRRRVGCRDVYEPGWWIESSIWLDRKLTTNNSKQ
jgi:hypothetical protein